MGIFGAMTTAVSGLRAQSFALEHISDNIANSQTIGFKRTETSFMDVVSASNPRQQQSGAVTAFTRATNAVQGDLLGSEVDTNLAINGDGYFVISERSGVSDGLPVFNSVNRFTRRGDFNLDKDGYLVNGANYYLMGNPIDAVTGNPTGGVPEVIKFSKDFLAAKPTSTIDYRLNLPTYPRTTNSETAVPDSELLSPALITSGDIDNIDEETFLKESLSGGATTIYDQAGNNVDVQIRWAKHLNTPGAESWGMYYLSDNNPALPTDTKWTKLPTNYVFGANSQLISPVGDVTITAMTINGDNLGNVLLKHGTNGVTQYSDSNGVAIVNEIKQNGYSAGELSGVSITSKGRVAVTYTNGIVVEKSQIALASFNADEFLQKQNGSAFVATAESGLALFGATGFIVSNQLEASNTDIAEEFSKLIVTQQAYAAGTRIVTTSNEMLQEVINMKR
ncbi:MAG: flagellar hook-basal body complex protein [Rhizobiales bacterium]|nr:flagellar hook-basal body complex protein [Hyphomicrobiales bacterium]NRB13843.1 flagellar hook-basal body complex protein [Hyphomicrobiales bacterium]